MNNWLKIDAKSSKEAKLKIHGIIGGDFFEEGVTDEQVERDLDGIKSLKADVINVDLSSLGGSVKHGMKIYDLLRSNSAKINIDITGLTASQGAIISQAADKGALRISENAQLLFHEARGVSTGTASQLEADAKFMRNINSQFATIISRRSGMTESKAKKLLAENNSEGIFKLPKEAKSEGLVDQVFKPENSRIAACISQKELNKFKIKAKINQNTNNMNFNIKAVKDYATKLVNAGLEKFNDEDKTTENVETLVSNGVELALEALQPEIDKEIKALEDSKKELKKELDDLKASAIEPKGVDGKLNGDDKPLTNSMKAMLEFKSQLSESDIRLMTKKD